MQSTRLTPAPQSTMLHEAMIRGIQRYNGAKCQSIHPAHLLENASPQTVGPVISSIFVSVII